MLFTERQARVLLAVALVLVAAGVWAFVLRGADRPADPYLVPTAATLPAGVDPPGDPARVPLEGFGEVAIAVVPADGGGTLAWCLLAALDAAQRAKGLMGVTDLQGYRGMAFVYDAEVTNGFYMRNTPMPLSIAWISADGRVVSTADMAPCGDRADCRTYAPAGPYQTAIEVPAGGLADLGITDGARVSVGGQCAARA